MQNLKFVEILLIEDNPGDARLTQEALNDGKIKNNLHIMYDGVEATDFLFRRNEYHNAPRPDLIILDLNLPKKNGLEVLAEIKADPGLKSIPVIVLTISKAEEDIVRSYNLHANCFLIKPIDLNQFFEVVRSIEDFWLSLVKLPRS
jgi:two-component system, chemotaxis family, response regulator Rcp1